MVNRPIPTRSLKVLLTGSDQCTVPPGDTVLVAGFGSGADVMGFNKAGCNVVAIENDQRHFDEMKGTMRVYAEEQEHLIRQRRLHEAAKEDEDSDYVLEEEDTKAEMEAKAAGTNRIPDIGVNDDPLDANLAAVSRKCTACERIDALLLDQRV